MRDFSQKCRFPPSLETGGDLAITISVFLQNCRPGGTAAACKGGKSSVCHGPRDSPLPSHRPASFINGHCPTAVDICALERASSHLSPCPGIMPHRYMI
jgi:hypothetical protein